MCVHKAIFVKMFTATLFRKENDKELLKISHLGDQTEKLVVPHKPWQMCVFFPQKHDKNNVNNVLFLWTVSIFSVLYKV